MKTIQLTQGKVALVDDEDFGELNRHKWYVKKDHRHWYAVRSTERPKQRLILMHRQVLGLNRGDRKEVDHRNGNGLDNRRCNLRICTHAENIRNQQKRVSCSSAFKGVHWNKKDRKWKTCIRFNCKFIYIGRYNSEIDAAKAYDKKAIELHGDFAGLNFPI